MSIVKEDIFVRKFNLCCTLNTSDYVRNALIFRKDLVKYIPLIIILRYSGAFEHMLSKLISGVNVFHGCPYLQQKVVIFSLVPF